MMEYLDDGVFRKWKGMNQTFDEWMKDKNNEELDKRWFLHNNFPTAETNDIL